LNAVPRSSTGARMPNQLHTAGHGHDEPFDLVQAIADHTLDAFLVTRAEPVAGPAGPEIVYVNPAFTRMTGYAPGEIIGQTPRILQTPDTDPAELRRIRRALENGESVRATLLNQTKHGELFWVELDIVPIGDQTGWYHYWISVQRDVTERVENERRLQQQDKLRALGEMAGGMAHEINNALQPLLGSIGLIAERLHDVDPRLAKHAETLEKDCLHARRIVRDVLSFARSENPQTARFAAGELVADVTDFIDRVMPSSVTIRRHGFAPDAAGAAAQRPVRVSRDGLIQVLQNLVSNAADAMGGRGTIDVSLATHAGQPDAVQIRVSDSGPGMDAATRANLFNPFFSTKPLGQGTGMGLSVAHGLVASWGGRIDVDTAPDAGTTVTITLPRADDGGDDTA